MNIKAATHFTKTNNSKCSVPNLCIPDTLERKELPFLSTAGLTTLNAYSIEDADNKMNFKGAAEALADGLNTLDKNYPTEALPLEIDDKLKQVYIKEGLIGTPVFPARLAHAVSEYLTALGREKATVAIRFWRTKIGGTNSQNLGAGMSSSFRVTGLSTDPEIVLFQCLPPKINQQNSKQSLMDQVKKRGVISLLRLSESESLALLAALRRVAAIDINTSRQALHEQLVRSGQSIARKRKWLQKEYKESLREAIATNNGNKQKVLEAIEFSEWVLDERQQSAALLSEAREQILDSFNRGARQKQSKEPLQINISHVDTIMAAAGFKC